MPFVAHAGYSNSVVHRLVSEVATTAANSSDSLPVPGCPARRIGIVLFEGFSLVRAGIIAEVFSWANRLAIAGNETSAIYTIRMLSSAGGSVPCSSGARG